MALLEKLNVQGIRSFGKEQSIEFNSPFTLILGRNGCGKTTIIEALKYAITGGLPFGQMASFVRDPKLDHNIETYGQVRLRFLNTQKKTMSITRSMQATQRPKKIESKTLDTSLSVVENGEIKQLSTRCMDADEWLSVAFGVAKPILSYVIFCHQEESYWPLDEGKKVKERFDEIFDSAKYNKCMLKIIDIRKGLLKEINELKTGLTFLKENVEIATTKKRELEEKQERLNALLEQVGLLDREIDELGIELESLERKYTQFHALAGEKVQLECSLKSNHEQQELMRAEITRLYPGSKQELEIAIDKLKNQLGGKLNAKKTLEEKIKDIKILQDSVLSEASKVRESIGSFENELQNGMRLKKNRNSTISRLSQRLGLMALEENASENDFLLLFSKVEEAFQKLNIEIEDLRQSQEKEQQVLKLKINKCLEQKTKLECEIKVKQTSLSENETQLKETNKSLNNANAKAKAKLLLDRKLQQSRQELENANKATDVQSLTKKIYELNDESEQLKKRVDTLAKESKFLNEHRNTQNQLTQLDKKINDLKNNIRRSRSKSGDAIKQLLRNSTDDSIRSDFDRMFSNLKQEIDKLRQQISEKEKEVSLLEQDRKKLKSDILLKKSELTKSEDSIFELCGRKKYEEVLESIDKDLDTLLEQKGLAVSSEFVYKGFLDKAKEDSCCPLCQRGFEDSKDLDSLMSYLSAKSKKFPKNLKEASDKFDNLQLKQRKLLELKPVQERAAHLRTQEIPFFEKNLGTVDDGLEAAGQDLIVLRASLTVPEENMELAESMQSDVYDIDRYQKELKDCTKEIESLKAKLPCDIPKRTFEEAFAEYEEVQKLSNQKLREKEAAEERVRVYNNRVIELREEVNKLVAEQLQMEKDLQDREQLKELQAKLEGLAPLLQAELEELVLQQQPIKEEEQNAQHALKTTQQEHTHKLNALLGKFQERNKEKTILEQFCNDYKQFEGKHVALTLEKKKSKFEELNAEQKQHTLSKDKMEEDLKQLEADITGFDHQKEQLNKNHRLKGFEEQETKLKKDLEKMVLKIGEIDVITIRKKSEKTKEKKNQLTNERDTLNGRRRELNDTIRDKQKELEAPRLKNADKNYKDKLIDFTIKSYVEKDLQAYYKALEYAMQHFHKDRMLAINKIIRELWRLIYKGNDIEYIEIKTDETSSTTGTSGIDRRRSYNYRVVQTKNGIELDMRGRCSAGQKVLACIIIRIALAEMFSANCGILTLDEPTTNLDKQNISSLTDAINEIVMDHIKKKKNFQLVVITHDREFLDRISHADFFSHYYYVSRDHDGKTVIVKKEVDDE